MIKTHLTGAEVKKHERAIGAIVRERAADWDIHGWSFQGRSPHIRLVVKVTAKRLDKHRDLSIPLPEELGGRLKVFVRATYARRRSQGPLPFSAGSLTGGIITPGASIVVDHGTHREWAGIAAVLRLASGPHILTCGHAFIGSRGEIFASPEEEDAIAELSACYFDARPRLDAALCKLTDYGVELLLEESGDAITWFTRFRRPRVADNGRNAVFWATNPESAGSYEAPISSYNACDAVLFGDGEVYDGFIEMPFIASGGDSGSLLSVNGLYYGICAGHVGDATLFTSFARAIDRVRQKNPEATLWTPGRQSQA
jgi:hypothetical protein